MITLNTIHCSISEATQTLYFFLSLVLGRLANWAIVDIEFAMFGLFIKVCIDTTIFLHPVCHDVLLSRGCL